MLLHRSCSSLRCVRFLTFITSFIVVLFVASPSRAYLIDFEGLSDRETVTNQFDGLGVTFVANTTALKAGLGMALNDSEFPPQSGATVVSNRDPNDLTDDTDDVIGDMEFVFISPVTSVSGFFTYTSQLLISAFGAGGVSLGTVSSAFNDNTAGGFGDTGSSPNEFLEIAAAGILNIKISAAGGDFTLDDLQATPALSSIPEPNSLLLLFLGVSAALGFRGRRSR
jgi:hypothetical protein